MLLLYYVLYSYMTKCKCSECILNRYTQNTMAHIYYFTAFNENHYLKNWSYLTRAMYKQQLHMRTACSCT